MCKQQWNGVEEILVGREQNGIKRLSLFKHRFVVRALRFKIKNTVTAAPGFSYQP
jgi:hypothetical protein